MANETLEGWYTDPYGVHDARWLSAGLATKLVRDGHETSYDPPPDGPWTETPEALDQDSEGGDLRRADDAEAGYDSRQARWAAYDQVAVQFPSAFDDVDREWPPR